MTLDEMIQQCLVDMDETPLIKSGGAYSGDDLKTANKLTASLNTAYHKICRERYQLTKSENVVLDGNKSFDANLLTSPYIKITAVERDEIPVAVAQKAGDIYKCSGVNVGDTVTVYYSYLPPRMSALTDAPAIPESKFDHRILCYYADFEYLNTEGDIDSRDRSQTFLAMFNDGYSNISATNGDAAQIQIAVAPIRPYSPLD